MKMKRMVMIIWVVLVGGIALSIADPSAGAFWKRTHLDVMYEPTSYSIAEEMLDLAGVSSEDVVYDLGCGDGRIVIMAAKKRGAKGVGVDLDPVRIKESTQNAASEGVVDRVRFYEQNLFIADIAEATVVMLYLFPEVNLRLRPKLLKDLTPGSRIVSHSHGLGEWGPDLTRKVEGRELHLFVIPANVTGIWQGAAGEKMSLSFTQRFQKVRGSATIGPETYPVRSCSLEGRNLSFTVERTVEGVSRMLFFSGKVSGETIEGRIVHEGGDHVGEAWTATREPFTSATIAE